MPDRIDIAGNCQSFTCRSCHCLKLLPHFMVGLWAHGRKGLHRVKKYTAVHAEHPCERTLLLFVQFSPDVTEANKKAMTMPMS